MKTRLLAILGMLGAACVSPAERDSPVEDESADQTRPPRVVAKRSDERFRAVRALLLARHLSDLPERKHLDRHAGAAEALRHLAVSDTHTIVRVRALSLLGVYPDWQSKDLLLAVLNDRGNVPALRAAALRGLARFPASARAQMTGPLVAALGNSDIRIAVAAAGALRKLAVAVPALERARADVGVPSPVRAACASALTDFVEQ